MEAAFIMLLNDIWRHQEWGKCNPPEFLQLGVSPKDWSWGYCCSSSPL